MCGCVTKKCDPWMCDCACHDITKMLLFKDSSSYTEENPQTSLHGSDVIVLAPEKYNFNENII